MPMRKTILVLMIGLAAPAFAADAPNLGKPVSKADMAAWDIEILQDGTGLPPGSGTAGQGAPIFEEKCALCHGDGGRGTEARRKGLPAPPAVVEDKVFKPIDGGTTSISNFWPYAPPLFDYIRRAMPWNMPRSLSDHEVYALTAYILAQSKVIDAKQVMNAQTLRNVRMPNRDGFRPQHPEMMPR